MQWKPSTTGRPDLFLQGSGLILLIGVFYYHIRVVYVSWPNSQLANVLTESISAAELQYSFRSLTSHGTLSSSSLIIPNKAHHSLWPHPFIYRRRRRLATPSFGRAYNVAYPWVRCSGITPCQAFMASINLIGRHKGSTWCDVMGGA